MWQNLRVLGAWLQNIDPFIFQINGIGPRWYGFSYVLAALVGYWLYKRLAQRGYADIAPSKVADLITWVGLCGVLVGGRVGWIIFYGVYQYHDPDDYWWWIRVNEGGMSSHGGILGIVIVTFILSRVWKVSWTGIGDCICVVATVGIFFVRCANFLNGELPGHPTDQPWGVQFAAELRDNAAMTAHAADDPEVLVNAKHHKEVAERLITEARVNPAVAAKLKEVLPVRHPSQLYEGFLEGLLLLPILWLVRTRARVPRGVITGLFFVLYPTSRIIGETYRIPDPAWSVGKLSAGQYLSLYMYAIGAAFLIWGLWRQEYEKADQRKSAAASEKASKE